MLNIEAEDAANRVHMARVRFGDYKATLGKTIDLYERTKRYGKPFGLTVTGETGSGKSTIIEELKALYPPVRMEETTVHPIVFINVPANPDIKFIYRGIIDQLGIAPGERATERQLRIQAITLLIKAETKLLVADEVQHFVERKVLKHPAIVADCFKGLMNEANVSIAFFGLPYLSRLLQANAQLRRRFSETYKIKGWSINTKASSGDFCSLIKTLLEGSKYEVDTKALGSRILIESIYYATDGRISNVATLLAETIRLMIMKKDRIISKEYLEKAFRSKIWDVVDKKRNPFDKKFNHERLIRCGECYAEGAL